MNKTLLTSSSDEFHYSEECCGYYVPEEMKKIWSIELDLFKKFSNVYEKNNLNYFMDGGTLLGAVRYKGFIPWDDDADVIMPREDYDKLLKIVSQESQYPHFFQNTLTEDGFFHTHAQLRNSETTGSIQMDGEKNVNKGIFIDIFVLDGTASNFISRYLRRKEIETKKKILVYEYDRTYNELAMRGKVIYKLIHCFFKIYPFKKFFIYLNLKVLTRYPGKKTGMVGDITPKWCKNVQWSRGWYEGYFYPPFENIQLRAPLFYKDALGRQYGDYTKIPRDATAVNGQVHGDITFDPEVPHQDYCIDHQDAVMQIGEKL